MSIIHEALKKVQSTMKWTPQATAPIEQGNTAAIQETMTAAPSAPPVVQKKNYLVLIASIIIILSAAGYLGYVQYVKYLPQLRSMARTIIPPKKTPAKPLAKIVATPKANSSDASAGSANADPVMHTELNIEGIMTSNGSTVALINGKIYTSGDSVEGLTIARISKNSIVILRDGKEEEIRVTR